MENLDNICHSKRFSDENERPHRYRLCCYAVLTVCDNHRYFCYPVFGFYRSQHIDPAYNRLLVGASSNLVPHEVTLAAEGSDIIVDVEIQRPEISASASGKIESSSLHYGLLFLMALIAATPGLKLSRRAKFGAIALVSMFLIHFITLMVVTRLMLSNVEGGGSLASNPWMVLFLTIGCDLFPLLVWGALSFRYWIPGPQKVAQTAT